jgi:hypothetical protein
MRQRGYFKDRSLGNRREDKPTAFNAPRKCTSTSAPASQIAAIAAIVSPPGSAYDPSLNAKKGPPARGW